MAIEYTLHLATIATAWDAMEVLRPLLIEQKIELGGPAQNVVWGFDEAFSISALEINCRGADDELYGFSATVSVVFRLYADAGGEAKPCLLRHLLALFEGVPGDAFFNDVAGGEILRRRAGKLEVNPASSFWSTPGLLALVNNRTGL